ncbi:MAG: ABC transporter permease [Lachnospiraceae bacterium]|nr:ABC transporter permease [Lachnospiraceae bacterium]
MNILRLSLFNLKKNKREAAAISFLTMVTVLMMAIFVANYSKLNKAFDESFKASGSVNSIVLFKTDTYHSEFKSILTDNYHTDRLSINDYIFSGATDVRADSGDLVSYNFLFVTEKTERRLENFIKVDAMTDDEVRALSHPLWLPVNFKLSKGLKTGDTMTIVKAGKDYPFTIAGFYETGLESSDGFGFKLILSDEDYDLFSMIFSSGSLMSYNCIGLSFDSDDFDFDEYIRKCEESSSYNLMNYGVFLSYEYEKANETMFSSMFLMLVAFLSAITMISALFMITHKVSNDIEDQMQQIGVLEALGYKAREISLAYLYEYVISGGLGCLLGIIVTFLITPFMDSFNEAMLGRVVHGNTEVPGIIAVALSIFVIVILFALLKTRTVKKYPPVTALRRGIGTHNFKRNVLPLEGTKGNINLRLAMKSLLSDLKSCIGVTVCIVTAGLTILFSMVSFDFFKDGTKGLESMMGIDTEVVMVNVMTGADPEAIRDRILEMPEVRKAFVSYTLNSVSIKGSDLSATTQAYYDYNETENIFPTSGRFPEHDNEVMISFRRSQLEHLNLGDNIVLEDGGLEKSYVITGITSSMLNSGSSVYFTSDGYRRIKLNARPDTVHVYLNDGVSDEEFEERIAEVFGVSAKEAEGDSSSEGSLEDKIRAAADEKIAVMLSQYGVTSVDYAVMIGDKLITGNSRPYVIKEVSSWRGIIKSQMGPVSQTFKTFTLLSALLIGFIVAVILSIIAASAVRRQRMSLGIMKGLGYSSKDLMKQMALRMMPVIIISLVIASVATVFFNRFFWFAIVGLLPKTNITVIILTDIVLVLFCYFVTYLGAGKIRKISVTELMTE